MLTLRNLTSGAVVATSVGRADNMVSRGIGLLGKASLEPHEGLWIEPCSMIHTMGMRATIDIFFVDRTGNVLKIVAAAGPNRLSISCRGAKAVVELGAAEVAARNVSIGDRLALE